MTDPPTAFQLTDQGGGARLISTEAPGAPSAWIIAGRGYTTSAELAHQAARFGFHARPVRSIPNAYVKHVAALRAARPTLAIEPTKENK